MLLIGKCFSFHAYISADLIFTRMKELDKCIELVCQVCHHKEVQDFLSVTIMNTVPQIVPAAPGCDTFI